MRAKWLSFWVRLAPVWATLWLISALTTSSLLWVHSDGTLCNDCAQSVSIAPPKDECCDKEKLTAPTEKENSVVNAANCRACCKSISHGKKSPFHTSIAAPAIIPPVIVLQIPHGAEEQLPELRTAQWSVSPSRAPPRGRAPPFDNSLSLT